MISRACARQTKRNTLVQGNTAGRTKSLINNNCNFQWAGNLKRPMRINKCEYLNFLAPRKSKTQMKKMNDRNSLG